MYNLIIADSNKKNAELIKHCLENNEYNILTSETGANILAKIKLFKPDLIILDVNLIDMSGFDVCRKVKSDPLTSDTLVLVINSFETRESRLRAIEAGADDFLEKNFDSVILLAKVKSLMRLKILSNQLKEKYSELEEKNRIIEMQLEMGKQIQSALIKETDFSMNNLAVVSKYMPAFAIGGDFYDIITIDNSKIFIIMGDVSGHGISSALITTMLKIMLKNLSPFYGTPDKFLEQMNKEFIDIFDKTGSDMYACVFCALIDTSIKNIIYSNAGHPVPIYYNSMDNNAYELILSGTPIGLLKDSAYSIKSISYSHDDMLFFYTDGLMNNFYKEKPEEFLKDAISILKHTAKENPKEILLSITENFCILSDNAHEKYQNDADDVSIILCRM